MLGGVALMDIFPSDQEIDISCERSGNEDTGRRIAEALGLNYVRDRSFNSSLEKGWGVYMEAPTMSSILIQPSRPHRSLCVSLKSCARH